MSFVRASALSLLLLAFATGCDSMSLATEEIIRLDSGDVDTNVETDGSRAVAEDEEHEDATPAF